MRKVTLSVMAIVVSILLVGCGTILKTDPSNSPPYVSFFSNGNAGKTIYYKLTNIQVKNVGSYLGTVSTLSKSTRSSGPSGWDTNIRNRMVTIREISGSKIKTIIPNLEIFKLAGIAVQYSKNGPYFKAIKQSKQP